MNADDRLPLSDVLYTAFLSGNQPRATAWGQGVRNIITGTNYAHFAIVLGVMAKKTAAQPYKNIL